MMSPGKKPSQAPFQIQPNVVPEGAIVNSAELPNMSDTIHDYFPEVRDFHPATELKQRPSAIEPVMDDEPPVRSYLSQKTNLITEALERGSDSKRGKSKPTPSMVNVAKKDHEKTAKVNNPYMKMQTLAGDLEKKKKADEKKRRWADDDYDDYDY